MTDEILKEIHAIKDANARKYRAGFAAMMRDPAPTSGAIGAPDHPGSPAAGKGPQGRRRFFVMRPGLPSSAIKRSVAASDV